MNEKERKSLSKADKKFQRGEPLANAEILNLRNLYHELEQGLMMLGTEFKLARIEVSRRYDSLDGFCRARGLKKHS